MKNLSKTQKTILVSIVIILILSVTVGISYALWTISLNQGGQNDIATSCFNITFAEKNNLSLQNSYPLYDADGKKLKPYELTITNNCDTYASYQMNLEVLNTSTLTSYNYIKAMVGTTTDGTESELKLDLLSNYGAATKTLSNALTAFKLDNGYLGAKESKTYTLRLWLDENVTIDTPNVQNTNIVTKVTASASYMESVEGKDVLSYVKKNADSSSTDVYTVPGISSDSCTYTLAYDGTTDNNLRYVGSNPCNYVKIDNEIWRIIGVMNNIDDGTGKKETRVKLIRNESIGAYSWDSSESSVNSGAGVNEWSQADLMKLLNPGYESEEVGGSLYYNGTSGNCYSGRNNATTTCDFTSSGLKSNLKSLIGDTLWNTGSNGTNDFEGKVVLMYPSDYGYETSVGITINRSSCLAQVLYNWSSSSYNECKGNDWLYDSSNWQGTISPWANSTMAFGVFGVRSSGDVYSDFASRAGLVRPSIYLLPSTMILSGEGTPENPYQIG